MIEKDANCPVQHREVADLLKLFGQRTSGAKTRACGDNEGVIEHEIGCLVRLVAA
ncbi:hypothetical protein FHS85_004299 [Rhodoligotrophos appendicifer]|uniref:hypothetical protein n=1 Tax=Rhodoligotrophos appendicifer TaxID=987056 RepID=UPI001FE6A2EE|nr:hypothetical protein [Rhodoligotrophos appendicifer]